MNLFVEISLIVVVATIVSLVMKLLRQPLVVGYMVAGVLVGPYAFNILQAYGEIELFSKIGVAILLFLVGLTLNPSVMREVGKTSIIIGVGQVIFTSIAGFFIARALGFASLSAFYIATALTFSSTIIVLKLLSDKGDVQKLYGKISVGLLLVQDIIAIILLIALTVLGTSGNSFFSIMSSNLFSVALVLLGKGVLVVSLLYLVSRYILPTASRFVSDYQEVLFIFSLAWGLGISSLFFILGFSIEIGALIAGVTLASSPFAYEIASRMKPLRDFFIMLFFVLLGSQMVLSQTSSLILPAIILSFFVLIGNPLIVFVLMNLLGYRRRTAFLTGLTVAQISEFSLILVTLGFSLGHLEPKIVSLITMVGIITIAGSTYLILYADQIYSRLRYILKLLSFRKTPLIKTAVEDEQTEIIILGYDRVGYDIVKAVQNTGHKYLVVDFNPKSIAALQAGNIPYCYGDIEDIELLQEISLDKANLVVSTIPELKANLLLTNYYRQRNAAGVLVVISHYTDDTMALYKAGASYVVMPHHLGAKHAASLIADYQLDPESFKKEKKNHMESLARRRYHA